MRVLVAYMSKTGNTKKVAQVIFEEISDEKEIKPIDEVESTEGYDIAFLGFPIHAMGPDKKTVELLEKHCVNGRNVALFITHMAPEDAQELAPDAKLRSWARKDNSKGQPDKARLDRARVFSKNVMKRLHESKAGTGGKRGKQEK
jgi:menaquinone-dependent protoporphyrinogen IX oxidase